MQLIVYIGHNYCPPIPITMIINIISNKKLINFKKLFPLNKLFFSFGNFYSNFAASISFKKLNVL